MSHDAMFRELVRQESSGGEQQDEGQQDKAVDYGGEHHLFPAVIAFENSVLDNNLMSQVDERVEKYNSDVGYKAFLPETHASLRGLGLG